MAQHAPNLVVVSWSEFVAGERTPPNWLVKGLITHPSTTIMVGDGGSRKSLYAQALSVALARGDNFLGQFEVPQARTVLYVQSESGKREIMRRFERLGLAEARCAEDPTILDRLYLVTNQPFRLDEDKCVDWLVDKVIRRYHVDFIVFDPLIDFHACDENSSQEMRPVAMNLRRLRDQVGVSILILHHTNKSDTKRGGHKSRGTTALWNWMDGRWVVSLKGEWSKMVTLYHKEFGNQKTFSYRPIDDGSWTDLHLKWDDGKTTGGVAPKRSLEEQILALLDTEPSHFKWELARETGASESSVYRALQRLRELGRIDRSEEKVNGRSCHKFFRKPVLRTSTQTKQHRCAVQDETRMQRTHRGARIRTHVQRA
jgi:hypothetical protein